jgi:hypothetical protein
MSKETSSLLICLEVALLLQKLSANFMLTVPYRDKSISEKAATSKSI